MLVDYHNYYAERFTPSGTTVPGFDAGSTRAAICRQFRLASRPVSDLAPPAGGCRSRSQKPLSICPFRSAALSRGVLQVLNLRALFASPRHKILQGHQVRALGDCAAAPVAHGDVDHRGMLPAEPGVSFDFDARIDRYPLPRALGNVASLDVASIWRRRPTTREERTDAPDEIPQTQKRARVVVAVVDGTSSRHKVGVFADKKRL